MNLWILGLKRSVGENSKANKVYDDRDEAAKIKLIKNIYSG